MNDRTDYTPVALYARVSSDRQDVDLSVSAQLRALRDYAQKNGYLVAREYVNEAESGRIADRPEFRKMIDEASKPEGPFREILVWKFSRFTRKREHAVAFKSMLRRKGVRVVSITEHADDSPTGKLMEAIIESVDEFYSENLAQEVTRGMREAASRGFWVASRVPYGYARVMVQDGAKKRPTLEPDPATSPVVKRIFAMAEAGRGILDITQTLNSEGIANPTGRLWSKNGVHIILRNEAYTGALVWGTKAKDKAEPVRVDKAFPGIVSKAQFRRVNRQMRSRAPKRTHSRRVGSSYLLSGLVRCRTCNGAPPGLQERQVLLLRLPVPDEARQRGLRRPQAQCPPLRRVGRRQDSLQHPHRVQHPRAGEAGGRGDGRHRQGAAPAAGDHRVGTCGREAQAGTALRPGGDHRPGHRRFQAPYPRPPGAAGEAGSVCGGGQGDAVPAAGGPRRRGDHHRLRPGHERVPERE